MITFLKIIKVKERISKFYNFIKGGNDSLSSLRRENIFIQLLEGLHPLESEIICLCKDRTSAFLRHFDGERSCKNDVCDRSGSDSS